MRWLLFALACTSCASSAISVRAPSAKAGSLGARWTVAPPELAWVLGVAVVPDGVYVLGCQPGLELAKIAPSGAVVWKQTIDAKCLSDEHGHPIAASSDGVIVATPTATGARIIAFDPQGDLRWQHDVVGEVREVGVATSPERIALSLRPRASVAYDGAALDAAPLSDLIVLELDRAGARVQTRILHEVWEPAECTYDDVNQLWLTTHWGSDKPFAIAGVSRPLSRGTWAVRLSGQLRFIELYRSESTWHTTVPSGFAVYQYREHIAFVDHEGHTRWRLELSDHGCNISPNIVAATPTRLLATLDIFCTRHGSGGLVDLAIEDHTEPGDELSGRSMVVDVDPIAKRVRSLRDLAKPPSGTKYAESPFGVLAFGSFHGELGLDSSVHSQPAKYACNSTLPSDAASWTSYETRAPSCRSGFRLVTTYPDWAFVSALH